MQSLNLGECSIVYYIGMLL